MFAAAHQRAGNEVEIATLDDATDVYTTAAGCPVHPLGRGFSGYHYNPELRRWIRANEHRFDGVIINGVWQYHALAARHVLAGRRPYIVFAHGALDPYFRHRYPLKHFKKLIYWTLFEQKNLSLAQAVCFTSEEEMRVAAEGFPRRDFKAVVIPYGSIGPSGDREMLWQSFLTAFPAVAGKKYLLFLGRLHPKKGCDILLDAFAQAAPQYLDLVMVGPDAVGWREELEAQAARLGITQRVHWTGALRGSPKWGALYGAEAFILPSHQENFGISVADALACGTIAAISDKVNIAGEVSKDGAAFVEPDTLAGTIRLIQRLVSLTEPERQTMRKNARECYELRYSLRNAADEVYRALGLIPH
jgi:glycosyltransferase involved in cell wall biosynthesis